MRSIKMIFLAMFWMGAAQAKTAVVMGGQGSDPAQLWPQLNELVQEIAADHNIPQEQVEAFNQSLLLRYSEKEVTEGGEVRRTLNGRLLLPRCAQSKSDRSIAFGMETHGVEDLMVDPRISETIGDALELALVDYSTSCVIPQSE